MSVSTLKKFAYKKIDGNVHVLVINLRDDTLKFITNQDTYEPRPVSKLAATYSAAYGINGDQFTYRGEMVYPAGRYASNGSVYNDVDSEPTLYISRRNEPTFTRPKKIWTAISGNHIILQNGKLVPPHEGFVFPRTAIGWNRRFMLWVVVDGNEAQGTGLSLAALSILMKSLGCQYAINMDGGGSSTMVQVQDNTVSVLNVPSDDNTPGRERPVSNFLGVR